MRMHQRSIADRVAHVERAVEIPDQLKAVTLSVQIAVALAVQVAYHKQAEHLADDINALEISFANAVGLSDHIVSMRTIFRSHERANAEHVLFVVSLRRLLCHIRSMRR